MRNLGFRVRRLWYWGVKEFWGFETQWFAFSALGSVGSGSCSCCPLGNEETKIILSNYHPCNPFLSRLRAPKYLRFSCFRELVPFLSSCLVNLDLHGSWKEHDAGIHLCNPTFPYYYYYYYYYYFYYYY